MSRRPWTTEDTSTLRELRRKSDELMALRAAIHAVCMDDMYEDFVCRVLRDAKAAIEKRAAEILDGANTELNRTA